jgi:hypothetical protein
LNPAATATAENSDTSHARRADLMAELDGLDVNINGLDGLDVDDT